MRETYVARGVVRTRARDMFPGYGFVRFADGIWQALRGTRGISRVVMSSGTPAVMPKNVVSDLIARHDSEGFVVLDEVNMAHTARFNVGDKVFVKTGAYSGRCGVFGGLSSRNRVRVLLRMLGRDTPLLVHESALEAAA